MREQGIRKEGKLVPGRGLEPRYSAPKADVLPIRRSRKRLQINSVGNPLLHFGALLLEADRGTTFGFACDRGVES